MKTKIALIILTLLLPAFAAAQAVAPMNHVMPKVEVIDGDLNPELIPDNVAYLTYFLEASLPANPTPQELSRQSVKLAQLGTTDLEHLQLLTIFQDFRSRYDSLVANYNVYAEAAQKRGELVDRSLLDQQFVDLTNSIRAAIKPLIVSAAIDVRVSQKKRHIKIFKAGGAQ